MGFESETTGETRGRGNGVDTKGRGYSRPSRTSGGERLELAGAVQLPELGVAADRPSVDQDRGAGPAAGQVEQALGEGRVVVERYLLVLEPARIEQGFRPHAVAAPAGRIHLNPRHYELNEGKRPGDSRPGASLHLGHVAGRSYKTEAVVLRSFRLGEADRVLHLSTRARGRIRCG